MRLSIQAQLDYSFAAPTDVLLQLYPASWRDRYEEEFREVLEACPLSLAVITDVCVGALDAQLHYGQSARQREAVRRTRRRRAAIAAVLLISGISVALPGYAAPNYRPWRSILG